MKECEPSATAHLMRLIAQMLESWQVCEVDKLIAGGCFPRSAQRPIQRREPVVRMEIGHGRIAS
ncbi:hypothetical protein C9407_05070 [Xanthomonas vasicola pv. vasculorum]|nr:hypothetical protein C9390_17085 [Xanthomonas vasicola pv. vasculorum]RNL07800.1 hypothetical protein C9407_05070 [Xanthomonas vasicola pv. vasculorum]